MYGRPLNKGGDQSPHFTGDMVFEGESVMFDGIKSCGHGGKQFAGVGIAKTKALGISVLEALSDM